MASSQYISEMLIALKANIEYLQKEGSQQIKLTNGIYLKSVGDFHLYRFEIPPLKEVDIDQEIELRVNFSTVGGRVTASTNDYLEVSIETFIGNTIAEAYLVVSSYYLLQKLYDKLQEIQEGKLKISDIAAKLFGQKDFISSHQSSREIPAFIKRKLNEDQIEALNLCLGSEVSMIWGPPGTGKTTFIASLIEEFTSQNLSVLLISHTNKATDGAFKKTIDFFKEINSSVYSEGKILRIGKIFDEDLRKIEEITPEYAIKLKAKALSDEVNRLSSLISECEDKLSKVKEVWKKLEKLERLGNLISDAEEEINKRMEKRNELMERSGQIARQITNIENKIGDYNNSNFFGRLFFGQNLESLMDSKSELLLEKGHSENLLKEQEKKLEISQNIKADYNEQIQVIRGEIGDIKQDRIQQEVERLELDLKSKVKERSILLEKIEELSISVISEALVIGTTLTKSYISKVVLSRPYDYVILDEASMAPMPAIWCAAGLARKGITIIGDFLQLPPITQYKPLKEGKKTEEELKVEAECVDRWLRSDIFHQLKIPEAIKRGVKPSYLKQLKIQYRMHPDIAELINVLVYGNYGEEYKLGSGEHTEDKGIENLSKEPLPGSHLGIINTGDVGSVAIRTDSGSRYNIYNALLSVELAKRACNNGYKKVGIICPFRAQANLIKKILKDNSDWSGEVVADTVHKYQGDEKQIIIFDTVTSDPNNFLDDKVEHGEDEQLLNVAFSRAQEKCIVLADVERIENKHSESSILKKFIRHCNSEHYPVLSSKGLLAEYPVKDEEKWINVINKTLLKEEFEQSQIYDQGGFYPAFFHDVLGAEKEVIIVSPFMTHERVAGIIPIFNNLIERGVRVFVITRAPKLQEGSLKEQSEAILCQLDDLGVTVIPLAVPVHQKLAFIDRKILWEGSLNILSQRNSSEIMRRFDGSESCKQMLSFLDFDKNIGGIGENKLNKCEYCHRAGAWYWTDRSVYGGFWTHCLVSNHKPGKKPPSESEIYDKKKELNKLRRQKKEYDEDGVPYCPSNAYHSARLKMVLRKGKWGKDFWGCPKYPRCKVTEVKM